MTDNFILKKIFSGNSFQQPERALWQGNVHMNTHTYKNVCRLD